MALVTSKEMFAKAYDGGYAIGAFNVKWTGVNNEQMPSGVCSRRIRQDASRA